MSSNKSSSLAYTNPLSRLDSLRHADIIELSQFCPLSEFPQRVTSREVVLNEIRQIIFTMNIFDEIFEKITKFKRHIYILGDGTIFNFLKKDYLFKDIYIIDKSYYLEIICTLGLSYRFNVAKKFGYSDTQVMQLRLNGWGREYCFSEKNIDDYFKLKEVIYTYWFSILTEYKKDYIQLIKLCDSTKRPLQIDKIHEINKKVPIQLVT